MTQITDGGPAFPIVTRDFHDTGMSLRDYFAGQVIVGAMVGATGLADASPEDIHAVMTRVAEIAYIVGDAMIDVRDRERTTGE